MKKYLATLKQSVQYYLVHRGRVVIWVLNDSLSFLIMPFIWLAVYADRDMIAGFSKADIVTYFIIIILIKLVSDSHISSSLREDVLDGRLNNFLIRPANFIFSRFLHESGYKLFSAFLYIPIIIIISIFFRQYLVFPQSVLQFSLFLISLITAFILSSGFQFIIGFACFWLGNNSGPLNFNHIADSIFSGRIAPLVFFPSILQSIALFLPFQYISYFPAQIYLGRIGGEDILIGFLKTVIWISFIWGTVFIMWRRGLKRYEGIGI
ncbi:MAG: ABC-2 family transporter protein [Parcubacteria group bacterium]|nr:ABC-2 family transporter protein [Parcubacteria group bacterium]